MRRSAIFPKSHDFFLGGDQFKPGILIAVSKTKQRNKIQ
jgi:hypothetical protein